MASGGGIQTIPAELTGAVFTALMWQLLEDAINNGIVTQLGCRVTNSGNISLTNNADVVLTFDTNLTDTDAPSSPMHSTTTNTSQVVMNWTGFYQVKATVSFATNATGERRVRIRLNGTTIIAEAVMGANGAAGATTIHAVCDRYFNAGDYVEVLAFQNSGGALSSVQNSEYSPIFSAVRV